MVLTSIFIYCQLQKTRKDEKFGRYLSQELEEIDYDFSNAHSQVQTLIANFFLRRWAKRK